MKYPSILKIDSNKKDYLPLLLLADEQEDMIDRYLYRGDMFAMLAGDSATCICIVTDEGEGVCEIKNIAVKPSLQRCGYGKKMIEFIAERYRKTHRKLIVGTGETQSTMDFYKHCGFRYSHRIPDFFTHNYSRTIIDDGVELKDMVYFTRQL